MVDNKTIIMKYNVDEFGNPISLKIDNENKQVSPTNNIVQLEQTPDELHRVVVLNEDGTQMTEVYNQDEVGLNTFFVDYNRAIVHFHSNQSSKKKIFNYYGKGMELISCERIFDAHDKQGNWVVRTLQDLIDRGRECLELIELLGDAVEVILSLRNDIKIGQELHNTLTNDIEIATPLQQKLHADIVEATKWKDQLHTDVAEGKVLQPLLHNDVVQGNAIKQQLDQSIADAQDDIAKIEATGNEIIYITSSQWVYNDTSKMYEKQVTHPCNSENIHVTCKATDTKDALFLPWKPIDKSNILLKSDEAIGVSVIISASYYKALIDNTTTQEVIDARKGEASLLDKMNSIDMQLENYATKVELRNYSLNRHMHSVDSINGISGYATTEYVDIKYNELFQSVSSGKELLASALTDKGVTTLATDSFEVMANNIRKITTSGGNQGGGGTGGDASGNITISQSSYTIQKGEGLKVNYTSSLELSTCMLLFAPDYNDSDCINGNVSTTGVFTFYTTSKAAGNYTVKVKGRKWNDSTSSYVDYYSNTFTLIIEDNTSGGGGETTTPITISNINDITVNSGSVFNIVYTTNVDAVSHEMSFDGGSTFNVIYPTGDKNGYTYQHEALTETSYPHQRKIRVTDAKGNTATSNTFNINVSTNGGVSTMSPFLASMYGNPRVIPNYPSDIAFPPINAHEDMIQPNGVNSTDSWKYGTRINQSPRSDWTRVGFWGQVYRQEGYGYDPDNVAVEIKDCKLWGWNGTSWVLIHDVSFTASNTSFYVENFAGDSNRTFPSNLKINGKNVTVKFDSVNSGYMFHPYSGKARASDYGLSQPYYYCSTMSARLVKWDSNGADNLDSAKLCFNVGGDFWHTTHETWQPDWSANGEYAQGQFLKCTREWKTAYCTNVPESWGNGFPSL